MSTFTPLPGPPRLQRAPAPPPCTPSLSHTTTNRSCVTQLFPTVKMPLFVLSPASLAHSALFSGYYSYLSSNVVALRLKTGVLLGDGEAGSVRDTKHKAGASDAVDEAKLKRAIRAHANFAESAPFTFFLIFLAELNGAPTSLVHGAFTTLFLARVAHGSIGVTTDNTLGVGRPIGAATTLLITAAAGLYNLNLGYEPLKSFLGFK